MFSTFDDIIFCLILFLPLLAFLALAKKHWLDKSLRSAFSFGLLSGAVAVLLVSLIYSPIELYLGGDIKSFLSVPRKWYISLFFCIGIIGFIEESLKALAAYSVCCFYNKREEGFRPTFAFMSFAGCAISFSIIENIQYYMYFGPSIVLPRVLISSTAHLAFASVAAWFSTFAFKSGSFIKMVIILTGGVLGAASLHGFFDFMLFQYSIYSLSGLILAVLSLFLYIIYEVWIYALKKDFPPAGFLAVCSKCRALTVERIRFCPFCGNRVLKITSFPTILKK